MTSSPQPNRLIHEKSPYLLQHAHNPVDWYPWGEEAFEAAKSQDKPIFLSIGYATCHWCHVMERESFENPEVAKLMNEVFVNIKVDREELPEVDGIYMEFAQALMSSGGGWPLNVMLTPDLKPFFAVTYLPPAMQRGMMGIIEFISQIKELWASEEKAQVLDQADKIVELFERSKTVSGDELPDQHFVQAAVELLFDLADPVYGGIRGEPKFPLSYQNDFLLAFAKAKNESRSLFYVELTLDMMSRGGLYDQLGGGFSRYTVDESWYIPHFEKMLYDNAILAESYLQAWRFTKKPEYKRIVEETLVYILREMKHLDGGFYSAQDADTEGHEGLYYTWTLEEIFDALPPEDAELFCHYYGVSKEGNFEGRSVLHIEIPLEEFAEAVGIPIEELERSLERSRALLLQKREARTKPFIDDKIIASWNGLMIDTMCKAFVSFHDEKIKETVLKSAEFVKAHLWKDSRLYRRYRDGDTRFSGGLMDYAYMIKGAISLFEAGFGSSWLQWAIAMTTLLEKEFKAENGAFYQTDEREPILVRKCEFYDGAEPSGNAIHCENLLRLYQMTHEEKYLKQTKDILKAAKNFLDNFSPGGIYHLISLQRYYDLKAPTVIIALDEKRSLEKEIANTMGEHYSPHGVILWKAKEDSLISALIPSLSDKGPIDGQTAVYICRQDICEAPLIAKEEILKALQAL